ncbi:MAG: DEAD/DEAH box helicase, partial [Rhodospirillales bacterium]|nr:DEAD/DEAH box helicase [Rhodospirillales bacterium]
QRLAADRRRPAPGTCRALVLAPTRELALQIAESFSRYGRFMSLRNTCVFGGVSERPQIQALRAGVDILIATPGRLIDMIQQRAIGFGALEIFVLDEADRMLDMGFIHDVRRIVRLLPQGRQTALLSATMPGDIAKLAQDLLNEPVRVEVTPPATTVERIEQRVMFVDNASKRALLVHLLSGPAIRRALVFSRTKHGANKIADGLAAAGIPTCAIHGNKSQGARQKALSQFKEGRMRVLVATDIAARGIDVDGITHVINYDLPNEPESYVHRIGRTARAGADGAAIAFCDASETTYLRAIERTTRQRIAMDADHPYHHEGIASGQVTAPPPTQRGHRQQPRRDGHSAGGGYGGGRDAHRGGHAGHGGGGRDGHRGGHAAHAGGGGGGRDGQRQGAGPARRDGAARPDGGQRRDAGRPAPAHRGGGHGGQRSQHQPR